MTMISFKQFLLEKITLYKPQPPGIMWSSEHPLVDVYKLPSSQRAVANSMNEFNVVRLAIDDKGDVYMWNAGVLHKIFWMQMPELKPRFNIMYYKGKDYMKGGTSNYTTLTIGDLESIMNKHPYLTKAFQAIHETFPQIKHIYFGDDQLLSITPPYHVIEGELSE